MTEDQVKRTEGEREKKQRLLAVLAHPDDETFGIGGTLALYAGQGVEVHLVCATRGEAGDMKSELLEGFNSIAERRESELRCAAEILGLSGIYFLDYRDSGMSGSEDNRNARALAMAPVDQVAAKVAHHIRLLHPQVVITTDPIGGYKHPDHIAIHKATVEAFRLASDTNFQDGLSPYQPQKLYYQTLPKRVLRMAVRMLKILGKDPHRFGRNGDIDLASIVEEGNFPIHAQIDYRSVAEKRDAAAACHASQLDGGPPRKGLTSWIWQLFGGKEQFMRGYPDAEKGLHENDLFEGVD
jgi:N-acetyl-1-D-myo-inositol-2-amino-2-deoxy-alpha-D-glucopyranoside deacetylase